MGKWDSSAKDEHAPQAGYLLQNFDRYAVKPFGLRRTKKVTVITGDAVGNLAEESPDEFVIRLKVER